MSNLVLTPSALFAFLSEIEELEGVEIVLDDSKEDQLVVNIGDSSYVLDASQSAEVEVDEDVIEEIEEANQEGYDELGNEVEDVIQEEVEGGIIKELIKTLALGGLVKMTKHALEKA